jgi:hypothetical protein
MLSSAAFQLYLAPQPIGDLRLNQTTEFMRPGTALTISETWYTVCDIGFGFQLGLLSLEAL